MYLTHYLAARSDAVRARIRIVVLGAALGILAAIMAASLIVVAVVLLVLGIAHGLAALFGSDWAGELLAGGGFLIAMAGGAWLCVHFLLLRSLRRTKRKYDRRRGQQRQAVGQDVSQRAAS
jgi:hypothetical protein